MLQVSSFQEGLHRVITAAQEKMARIETLRTQQTRSLVEELQRKLERANGEVSAAQ